MKLRMTFDPAWKTLATRPVTTKRLGLAQVPQAAYENFDGTPLMIDTDYFGKKRNAANPSPGPFEDLADGEVTLKVW